MNIKIHNLILRSILILSLLLYACIPSRLFVCRFSEQKVFTLCLCFPPFT